MKHVIYLSGILLMLSSCSAFRKATSDTPNPNSQPKIEYPAHDHDISLAPAERPRSNRKSGTTAIAEVETIAPWQFKYAILMNLPVEDITNTRLYSFIDEWYGTPYRYGGNTKKGIDCSAFTLFLFADVYGAKLPRTSRDQFTVCEKISRSNLEEGDLVFFKERTRITHVGIYLGYNKFAHASSSRGVMISDLDELYFSRRFAGGGRVKQENWADGSRAAAGQ